MSLRNLLLPLLLLIWLPPGIAAQDQPGAAAATYSTTVSEEELASWRQHVGRTTSTDRQFDLEELALVKSLATEAAWLGLDRQLEVRLEIELEEAALAEDALRREVAASMVISQAEIEAKYQSMKDTFTHPRRVRLRNLFKRYPPGADSTAKAAVRAEMEELRRRLLAGQDFSALAAAHSDSQTRFQGGLIGNVPAGTLAPEVDAIAMALHEGELSEILSGPDGLTLLFCEKILPKVVRSPEELHEIAHQRLANRARRQHWEALRAEWLAAAAVQIHWQILESEVSRDQAVAVEFADGTLSRRQLAALMGPPRPLSEIPQPQLRQRIEAYLIARQALATVEQRGVAEFEGLESRMLWARRRILATRASLHAVEQRFQAPSEDEVRQVYEAQRESFLRPLHLDLAAILLPPVGSDLRESFRQGELLVHRLKIGDITFEEAARQYSRHPSAQNGGHLGWISRPSLPRIYGLQVLKAILRLEVGEQSGLVQDGDKLWIFQLLATEEARPMTWEEARTQAENLLGNERVSELEAQLRRERLQSLRIEVP